MTDRRLAITSPAALNAEYSFDDFMALLEVLDELDRVQAEANRTK